MHEFIFPGGRGVYNHARSNLLAILSVCLGVRILLVLLQSGCKGIHRDSCSNNRGNWLSTRMEAKSKVRQLINKETYDIPADIVEFGADLIQ